MAFAISQGTSLKAPYQIQQNNHDRHGENYFRDYYQKHREKLLTPQRREKQKL